MSPITTPSTALPNLGSPAAPPRTSAAAARSVRAHLCCSEAQSSTRLGKIACHCITILQTCYIGRAHCWRRHWLSSRSSPRQLQTAEKIRPLQQSAYAWAAARHSAMAFCFSRNSSAACTCALVVISNAGLQERHIGCGAILASCHSCAAGTHTPSSTFRDRCCSGSFMSQACCQQDGDAMKLCISMWASAITVLPDRCPSGQSND